jgi:alpha-glucosidase (family GH31 glycosyl hydrolase)
VAVWIRTSHDFRHGDLRFNRAKFPDPKAMTVELHRLGYHVAL